MQIAFGLLATLAILTGPVWAQSRGSYPYSGPSFHANPLKGAPYSAELVRETVRIGPDGTHFTRTGPKQAMFRDSRGDMRIERTVMGENTPPPPGAPLIIEIHDAGASLTYILDTQEKVAHRVAWVQATKAAASRAAVTLSSAPEKLRPESSTQDLGRQEIEGVIVQGTRRVAFWPAGSAGNDQPFQSISESWFSPELHEMVLQENTDPRSGESTIKLTHISRAEPPASLFQVPPNYKIVDETGPFQIEWTVGQP